MTKQSKKTTTSKKDTDAKKLQQQIDELTDSLMRERADSENIRRRHNEQLNSLKSYVKAEAVRELLPALDNVERALQHVPEELEGNDYVKGVQGVAKQFQSALKKIGVKPITSVGEVFNPELHEAISMDDSGDGDTEVVSEELQSGYIIDEHVIRHAMVRVALQKK
jgi:molecular chaperone GrpE